MRKSLRLKIFIPVAMLMLFRAPALPQADEMSRSWNQPVKPFRVIANIYYVGASEVTSFLITTSRGHILLDSGFAETVPLIRDNVERLGFKLKDIKILINSHAHFDHAGGLALLKELTGAELVTSRADAELISRGGKNDFHFGDRLSYRPARADRVLNDEDKVELGGVTMTARITPGHTKGCTTWTMKAQEGGRRLDVVFVGSATIPGYRLVGNAGYPNIAADYARTFSLLKSLKCDVFLASHGSFFSLKEKMRRLEDGEKPNPFIDPEGYRNFVERSERGYRDQLERERRARGGGP